MIEMLRDLITHKAWASATLIAAVRASDTASLDDNLRVLLHHIILANRFWLFSCLNRPFAVAEEARVPDSLDAVSDLFRSTHVIEAQWISGTSESELARHLEGPLIPGGSCSIAHAYMQVCLHSQGHRSQCATRLRSLGGQPPVTDFIVWLNDRPPADWS
ncbi:MAG TPA: hypothetical protein VKA59_21245 [Vicinamibacterales bacterium]|nr:hypothetical protein [Vicinamibacterales bacterium]